MLPLHAPRRILVIKLRPLGNTLLLTAPLQALHLAYPNAEIDVVATQAWLPLLEGQPGVRKLIGYERRSSPAARAKSIARLALTLRRENYDWAINFHASPSSSALAFASGAKVRSVHFHGAKDKNRYSTLDVPGKGIVKPIIERDMDTIRALGLKIPVGAMPRVILKDSEKEAGLRELAGWGLDLPLMVIGLGASRPTKIWPIERYAELAQLWIARTKGSVLLPLASDEMELSRKFLNTLPQDVRKDQKKIKVVGGLELRKLSALIANAAIFVGNDSGPKHLAVSLGLKTVTLFGPEHPYEWHPYPTDRHPFLFIDGLSCRKDADPGMPEWCALTVCTIEKHRCMRDLSVAQVAELCL